MSRSSLRAGKPLARTPFVSGREPLPARSRKRKEEAAERRAVVEQVKARDGYACQAPAALAAAGIDGWLPCGGPLDVHERITRASWPAGYLVAANCLTLCRYHHHVVHGHPMVANEVGLLAPSTAARPAAGLSSSPIPGSPPNPPQETR